MSQASNPHLRTGISRTGIPRKGIAIGVAAGVVLCSGVISAVPAAAQEPSAPKNIIVLISDGAGFNQFDAASLYESGTTYGQVTVDPSTGAIEHAEGTPSQVYQTWPVQVASSHYSANGRASYSTEDAWGGFDWVKTGPTDSAAAATALATGVKTNNGVLGYTPDGKKLLTVGEQAAAVGKATGVVTTVPFNHATPAGFIAHNPNRNDYHGVATEMIDSELNVIIGAGHPNYTDDNRARVSNFKWISQPDFERVSQGQTPYKFIESKGDFAALADGSKVPDRVFGLLQVAETSQYNRSGLANNTVLPGTDPFNDIPSLATLAKGALNVLNKDEDGFFLMVEGGAVDWAGHANQTTRVIEEQLDFNAAVEAVDDWVATNSTWDETLVIVTADHETGYLAGPGAGPDAGWTPLTGNAGELPQVSWHSGDHTNALVPFFAKGTGSELLQARATSWDVVRGAYLDNTDVGKTVFDLLGHADSDEDGEVALRANVPLDGTSGALSLSVAEHQPVAFAGDGAVLQASLPKVSVTDSRSEVQAQGKGWTLSGSAGDFVAGNRTIAAENLGWTPAIVSSDGGASAGAAAHLDKPVALAETDRATRVGTTVADAALELNLPASAEAGRYGSEITLTLFARD